MKKSKFSAETVKKNLNGWKEELVNFYNDWLVIIKAHLAAADTNVISHEKVREEMDSINRKYDFILKNIYSLGELSEIVESNAKLLDTLNQMEVSKNPVVKERIKLVEIRNENLVNSLDRQLEVTSSLQEELSKDMLALKDVLEENLNKNQSTKR